MKNTKIQKSNINSRNIIAPLKPVKLSKNAMTLIDEYPTYNKYPTYTLYELNYSAYFKPAAHDAYFPAELLDGLESYHYIGCGAVRTSQYGGKTVINTSIWLLCPM